MFAAVIAVAGLLGMVAARYPDRPGPEQRRAELQRRVQATVFPRDFARLPDVALRGRDGSFDLRGDTAGRWTLVYLGYTHCPDVCPTTLQAVASAFARLDRLDVAVPRMMFVSVDPRRDTARNTARYAHAFDSRFVGITGAPAALHRLSAALHLDFSVPADPANDRYTVQHTAGLALIDPDARLRAFFTAPVQPATLATDLRKILETLGSTRT